MNLKIEFLLKFCISTDVTAEMILNIPEPDLNKLVIPKDRSLGSSGMSALKAKVAKIVKERSSISKSLSSRSLEVTERIRRLEEENKKLKREKERADEIRKIKIKEYLSQSRENTSASLRYVQSMVAELRNLGSTLDICFCIDGTGSMSGLINSVKQCIIKVSQRIESTTGMNCRFALVVYRDYGDSAQRHQIFDFCNSGTLSYHLASISATGGGGDGPEDCFGGLMACINRVSWRAPSKIIIWMGDAPQHGTKYSRGGKDDYPRGDPDGVTSEMIFKSLLDNKTTLVFCKLTSYTDVMMKQLRVEVAPFGQNLLIEYDVEGEIADFIVNSISLTAAGTAVLLPRGTGKEKVYFIKPARWSINRSE